MSITIDPSVYKLPNDTDKELEIELQLYIDADDDADNVEDIKNLKGCLSAILSLLSLSSSKEIKEEEEQKKILSTCENIYKHILDVCTSNQIGIEVLFEEFQEKDFKKIKVLKSHEVYEAYVNSVMEEIQQY